MSKSKPVMRDVTIGLKIMRNFLLGRKHDRDLRFSFLVSTRSPDPPQLPPGPHSKLSDNYYYTRDARHIVEPPISIAGPEASPLLESGKEKSKTTIEIGGVVPGKVYAWDAPEKDAYATSLAEIESKVVPYCQNKVH